MDIEIKKGDLSTEKADVLVNAAGTSLEMGGGVAAMLKKRGGIEIEIKALKHAPIPLGSVIATTAGKLNARFVFHAAAQPHYGNFKATMESVKKATTNCLIKAEELKCKSIAFPALGCGIAGLEIEKGAIAILSALKEFASLKPKNLKKAKVVLFSTRDLEVFKEKWSELKGN